MVRWVNNAMSFAMFFAFLAIFAVKLRCVLCVFESSGFAQGYAVTGRGCDGDVLRCYDD